MVARAQPTSFQPQDDRVGGIREWRGNAFGADS